MKAKPKSAAAPAPAASRGRNDWSITELREMLATARDLMEGISSVLNSATDKGLTVINCEPLGIQRAASELATASKSIGGAWIDIQTGKTRRKGSRNGDV